MITRETLVEEIMEIPNIISFFIERGISPISCSGAFPGSLGKLLEIKHVPDPDAFIEALNDFIENN